jgi:hypothetical protein
MINVICAVRRPLPYCPRPNAPGNPLTHASMDHRYNSLHFLIQNSNSYSLTSQTFLLQGSHTGPPPVMLWGGSPAAGQRPMSLPPLPPGGYLPPLPSSGYWPPPPPAGHLGHSSNTPPPPFGHGYWPLLLWALPAGGQAPPWILATTAFKFSYTFNCSIRKTSSCQTSPLVVHLCLQVSLFVGQTRLCRWGPKHGWIR